MGHRLSPDKINKLKQWVASGLPLVTEMYVGSDLGGHMFSNYNGEQALSGNCGASYNNH